MIKTLLIPIDFTVGSLKTLKLALDEHKLEQVHVVLMYAQSLSTSISELLFYSPYKTIESLTTSQFSDALTIIKNSYESRLLSIHIHLFHGTNSSAFTHFHAARKIDIIYLSKNYKLQPRANGFDPTALIIQSNLKVIEVKWHIDSNSSNDFSLDQLFN